jgi:hypothetical protein
VRQKVEEGTQVAFLHHIAAQRGKILNGVIVPDPYGQMVRGCDGGPIDWQTDEKSNTNPSCPICLRYKLSVTQEPVPASGLNRT